MPVPHALGLVNVARPAFMDHLSGLKKNGQVGALFRADGSSIKRGNANTPGKSHDQQEAQPFSAKENFYELADESHFWVFLKKR